MLDFIIGKPIVVQTDRKLVGVSEEISEILYYASLAPNSHNTQMWKVVVHPSSERITIHLDEERTLDKVDSSNREAFISIGAYTQNLLLAFEAYGYDVNLKINYSSSDELVVIIYKKLCEGELKHGNIDSIVLRHSDKRAFAMTKIDEDIIKSIVKKTSGLHYFAYGSEDFEYIKTVTLGANIVQAVTQERRDELACWLRFSNDEAVSKKDGLPAEQLGITGIKKTLYYLSTNHKNAGGDRFAEQGINTVKKQLDNCAGFFVLTGIDQRSKLIETGMALERFWLQATELGISVQGMSQALEESPFKEEIQECLNFEVTVQMILRVGYTKYYGKSARIRRDLKEYVLVE
ncbi:MAG: nitroreductase family protein [Clostridioides sp.]|jgi:nitroreductase|nr:nitroreductase family protein [Clostridioides sp.]